MSDQNCWDVNPGCGYGDAAECNDECPAYKSRSTCWQFDWASFAEDLERDSREFWGNFFKEQCGQCTLYEQHRDEMDAVINMLLGRSPERVG